MLGRCLLSRWGRAQLLSDIESAPWYSQVPAVWEREPQSPVSSGALLRGLLKALSGRAHGSLCVWSWAALSKVCCCKEKPVRSLWTNWLDAPAQIPMGAAQPMEFRQAPPVKGLARLLEMPTDARLRGGYQLVQYIHVGVDWAGVRRRRELPEGVVHVGVGGRESPQQQAPAGRAERKPCDSGHPSVVAIFHA